MTKSFSGVRGLATARGAAIAEKGANALADFVRESNRIEGIVRTPTPCELAAHREFLTLRRPTVPALERFVTEIAGVPIRKRGGMNVRVGNHHPPPGGSQIVVELRAIIEGMFDGANGAARSPYETHQAYEHLHPFMDGNGRSGRVLWAWQRQSVGREMFALGFLHSWYYESLDSARVTSP